MTEQLIHQKINAELIRQYKAEKEKWLNNQEYTEEWIEWEPNWEWIRSETEEALLRGKIEDYLYKQYGKHYLDVFAGHVFQCWERLMQDYFKDDLKNTKIDLRVDGKQPVTVDEKMTHYQARY